MRLVLVVLAATLLLGATAAEPTSPDSNPPTRAQLKAKISRQANRIARLTDEIEAQDAVIADQNGTIASQGDTISRLRARDPLDAVLARNPDGLWAAVVAIWGVFPALAPGQLCGYDKATVPGGGVGLALTSFQFYRWTGC